MSDRCYFKGEEPPTGWDWTTMAGWWFTCDATPDAGGVPLSFTTPERHEPAFWIEGDLLFAQRDRPGRYPFAWLENDKGVFVSSDVEFLERIVPVKGWNTSRITQTLSLYDDPGLEDCRPGVFRIKPGERVSFNAKGLLKRWAYPRRVSIFSEVDAVDAVEVALTCACAAIPTYPTVLISGGLDSTTLAALLVVVGKAPTAATMISRFESQNEEHVVRRVCEHLNIAYQTFSIDDFKPFEPPGLWTNFTGYGFGLYPDMVYQIPFLEFLKGQGATHFVSGFGADQFFSVSPYQLLQEGIESWDLETCQMALDQFTKRTFLGHMISRLRIWRRIRTSPSWNQPEFWLSKPISATPLRTLDGWWYERAVRAIRLQEKYLKSPIFTPYCSAALIDVVEAISPHIRMAYSNKYLLRLVAQKYLPKNIAWAPKSGFFSDFWAEQLREVPTNALLDRLEPLRPYFVSYPFTANLLEHELSNMVSNDSTCYALTNAVCVADILASY